LPQPHIGGVHLTCLEYLEHLQYLLHLGYLEYLWYLEYLGYLEYLWYSSCTWRSFATGCTLVPELPPVPSPAQPQATKYYPSIPST